MANILVVETFTASTTWVCPEGVATIQIEAVGGGGGGGNQTLNNGGGGGGAAYAKTNAFPVTYLQSYTITIGNGGIVGLNANGGAGSVTTFNGTTTRAAAGSGGINTGAGGAGGTAAASIGDVTTSGSNGVNNGAGGAGAPPMGAPGGEPRTVGNAPGGGGGGGQGAMAAGPGGKGRMVLTYTIVPTDKTHQESNSVAVSESSSLVITRFVNASDASTLSAADTSSTNITLNRTDTAALSLAESITNYSNNTASETRSLAVSESSSILVLRTTTDTSGITVSETNTLKDIVKKTYTTTQSWVAPPGVTSVDVKARGAGGAGNISSVAFSGGGGGGGAFAETPNLAVTPGAEYLLEVGGNTGTFSSSGDPSGFFSTWADEVQGPSRTFTLQHAGSNQIGSGIRATLYLKPVSTSAVPAGTVTLRSESSRFASGFETTCTVPKPTGTVNGNLLIAFAAHNSTTVPEAPAGWTLIAPQAQYAIGWWKIAGPSEPESYTFTNKSGPGTIFSGNILRITGHDPNNPIAAAAYGGVYGTPTSLPLPSVTTTTANSSLVQMVYAGNTAATWTPPSGTTEFYDRLNDGSAEIAGGSEQIAAVGATGTRTWTSSSGTDLLGLIAAVNPSPAIPAGSGDITLHAAIGTTGRQVGSTPVAVPPLPANLQPGDVIIGSAITDPTIAAPPGWTLIGSTFGTQYALAYRVVTSTSESGQVLSWTGGATTLAYDVSYAVYRGVGQFQVEGTYAGVNNVNLSQLVWTSTSLGLNLPPKTVRAFVTAIAWSTAQTNYSFESAPLIEAWDTSDDNTTMYQGYEVMPGQPNTALVQAAGGRNGNSAQTTSHGAGGSGGTVAASIGTNRFAGGNAAGGVSSTAGGGGGGGAGDAANGGNAAGASGGAGGVSGGGSAGNSGIAGNIPGGGGGGEASTAGVFGPGARGQVDLTYLVPVVPGDPTQVNKSASDGGSISLSESTSRNIDITATDAGAVSVLETSIHYKTIEASDSATITVNETTSRFNTVAGSDSGYLQVTENSNAIISLPSGEDHSVGAAEEFVIDVSLTHTDTSPIRVTDTSAVAAGFSSSDSSTVALSESSSIESRLTGIENDDLAVSEQTSTNSVGTASDGNGIRATESSNVFLAVSSTDAASIATSETSNILELRVVSAQDSKGLRVTESRSTKVFVSATDTAAITISLSRITSTSINASDGAGLRATESYVLRNFVESTEDTSVAVEEGNELFIENKILILVWINGEWTEGNPLVYTRGRWRETNIFAYLEGMWVTHE